MQFAAKDNEFICRRQTARRKHARLLAAIVMNHLLITFEILITVVAPLLVLYLILQPCFTR